jgi:hypothetical protein
MINPSNSGWIKKFFASQKVQRIGIEPNELSLYKQIRETGLVYGHAVSFENCADFETTKWTTQEFTKVLLLVSLYQIYEYNCGEKRFELFIENVVVFYKKMNPDGFSLIKKLLPENNLPQELEKILEDRVQTTDNVLTRNFSHILTNALLFEDILAYNYFLSTTEIPLDYIKNLEEALIGIISFCLQIKETKSTYNDLLIKLLESSFRFTKFSNKNLKDFEKLDLSFIKNDFEKLYLIDLAVLAMWNETQANSEIENEFLFKIAALLKVDKNFVLESVFATNTFLQTHKLKIPYFNYSNPVKHFYSHITDSVKVLIDRNRTRLIKELVNNRDLAFLISQAAIRHLDDSEKKKIKKQLIEIFRTVPSLAVFMLPGGSLLLPILIKFIPKMLPTAFNENLENDPI